MEQIEQHLREEEEQEDDDLQHCYDKDTGRPVWTTNVRGERERKTTEEKGGCGQEKSEGEKDPIQKEEKKEEAPGEAKEKNDNVKKRHVKRGQRREKRGNMEVGRHQARPHRLGRNITTKSRERSMGAVRKWR